MANVLERFFEEALSRISAESTYPEGNIQSPNYPEHDGFDPTLCANDNDYVIPAEDRWNVEVAKRQMVGRDDLPPVKDNDRNLLDGGIREAGFDVYAFYKSRRYLSDRPYPGKWGVFYLEHGILRIEELIEETYPGYGSPLRLAHEFLRAHEHFHFKFDLYALSTEAKIGKPLYEPLKFAFRRHRIYQLEEALANRDAWDWAKQKRIGLGEFAYDFLKLQPGAYARFDQKKAELSSELAANLLDLNLVRIARRQDQAFWVANVPDTFLRRSLCPEYVVYPVALSAWISPAWRLPEVNDVTESVSFSRLLSSKYASLKKRWKTTKKKLIQNAGIPGLDFKRWNKSTGQWSVRVNDNFRAHLSPIPNSPGNWEAQDFGSHKTMGHG